MHQKSQYICKLLKVNYINFSIPENFIKLLDLIFKFNKHFNLHIRKRNSNFLEDTLDILSSEIEEDKFENPLRVKDFSCYVKNEYWSRNAGE